MPSLVLHKKVQVVSAECVAVFISKFLLKFEQASRTVSLLKLFSSNLFSRLSALTDGLRGTLSLMP
jgi:hypothetical protein